ncbi:MAG: hypothetical protein AB8B60_12555 [Sulfitobacter sp.]
MTTETVVTEMQQGTDVAQQAPAAPPAKNVETIHIVPNRPQRAPGPARFRARNWLMLLSFLFLVVAPTAIGIFYLYARAADQFHSTVGFSVHSEDTGTSLDGFGGLLASGNSSGASDSDILYEYIRSQQLVEEINRDLDLVSIFNKPPADPIFTLGENPTIEELHAYWAWMVSIAYDSGTGIIEVEARAFSDEDAHAIAQALVKRSTDLINDLSSEARQDAIRFAAQDLEEAETRLRDVRRQIRTFRDTQQQIDPTADIEQLMGVVRALEGQMAALLIDREVLIKQVGPEDSRVRVLDRRIEATDRQIELEKSKVGIGTAPQQNENPALGGGLAGTVGDYEELVMDREFAEQAYVAVLAAYTEARAEARRKHRYLATHVGPTYPQEPLYPRRLLLSVAMAFVLLVGWLVTVLVIFNVRQGR